MFSVTLDRNIWISGLKFGGKPMTLVEKGIIGEVDIAVSEEIIEETLGVLRDKFGWNPGQLTEANSTIRAATRLVTPTIRLNVVPDDVDDNRIIECAIEAGTDKIITHDNDLLRMREYEGIEMLKVAAFLQSLPD